MIKRYTCIVCPNGCEVTAGIEGDKINGISGNLCPKGAEYVRQELTNPRRTIATSVLVRNGILPLVSVRLTEPIPKDRIFDAMAEIRKLQLDAPVDSGMVLIHQLLGFDCDVITTKAIPSVKDFDSTNVF